MTNQKTKKENTKRTKNEKKNPTHQDKHRERRRRPDKQRRPDFRRVPAQLRAHHGDKVVVHQRQQDDRDRRRGGAPVGRPLGQRAPLGLRAADGDDDGVGREQRQRHRPVGLVDRRRPSEEGQAHGRGEEGGSSARGDGKKRSGSSGGRSRSRDSTSTARQQRVERRRDQLPGLGDVGDHQGVAQREVGRGDKVAPALAQGLVGHLTEGDDGVLVFVVGEIPFFSRFASSAPPPAPPPAPLQPPLALLGAQQRQVDLGDQQRLGGQQGPDPDERGRRGREARRGADRRWWHHRPGTRQLPCGPRCPGARAAAVGHQ